MLRVKQSSLKIQKDGVIEMKQWASKVKKLLRKRRRKRKKNGGFILAAHDYISKNYTLDKIKRNF